MTEENSPTTEENSPATVFDEKRLDELVNMTSEKMDEVSETVSRVFSEMFGEMPENFMEKFSSLMKSGQQTMKENESEIRERIQKDGPIINTEYDEAVKKEVEKCENNPEKIRENLLKVFDNIDLETDSKESS